MTREEAIAILKDLWTYLQTDIRQALDRQIGCIENEFCNGGEGCFNVE